MRQLIIPYLMFKNTLEAANYYKEIFDGEIEEVMYGDRMPGASEDEKKKIIHLELKIQGQYIYMFDGDTLPNGHMSLLLDFKEWDELKTAYEKMKKTSKVIKELSDTFWGAKYAVLEDKYGMKWDFHFMKPSN